MAYVAIDKALNVHLGLPEEYPLDKKEAFSLYQLFMHLFNTPLPISRVTLLYYADERPFFHDNPKTKQDKVVKDILLNLNKEDQFWVLSYIGGIV